MTVTNGVDYPEPAAERHTMGRMRGMHARLDGLTSLVMDNPLLAAVAGIGFAVSFQTVSHLASQHGLPGWPVLYPIGVDLGILALTAEARMLLKARRSDIVPRALAWTLAVFTVWANIHGSPARDLVGRGLHAVMPSLWIVFLELTRRRLIASQRADMIPLGRWLAAPAQTARLWQRMHRDDVKSYPLALELEQARLYARDLVRAAPAGHRPVFSSLLRKRIRGGRLPETVRKAVRASMANEYAPGWEEPVTEWVTTAMALPAHIAASLENTRAAITRSAARSDTGSAGQSDPVTAPEVTPAVPPVVPSEVPPVVAPEVSPRRRRVVPAKATNDQLAALILEHSEDPAGLNPYQVNKILKAQCAGKGVGEPRAAALADLAQRRHREHRVVAIGERR